MVVVVIVFSECLLCIAQAWNAYYQWAAQQQQQQQGGNPQYPAQQGTCNCIIIHLLLFIVLHAQNIT